jgi:hypothetical protein
MSCLLQAKQLALKRLTRHMGMMNVASIALQTAAAAYIAVSQRYNLPTSFSLSLSPLVFLFGIILSSFMCIPLSYMHNLQLHLTTYLHYSPLSDLSSIKFESNWILVLVSLDGLGHLFKMFSIVKPLFVDEVHNLSLSHFYFSLKILLLHTLSHCFHKLHAPSYR